MQNAHVIKKVRETRHLALEDVANYAHISAARLSDFESGKREPSFVQLSKLASIYGVTPFALASTHVPELQDTLPDFRKAVPAPAQLSPAGLRKIWLVEGLSQLTNQLRQELRFNNQNGFDTERLAYPNADVAVTFRKDFDGWLKNHEDDLDLFGSFEQKFYLALRIYIESKGVVINIDSVPSKDYFGFYSKPSDGLPIIFVNREVSSRKAQLFTLLHELCHYFIGKQGVSDPFQRRNDTERLCNIFAANFLAPLPDFTALVKQQTLAIRSDTSDLVDTISRFTLLSGMATAVRLKEAGFIDEKRLREYIRLRGRYSSAEKKEEQEAQDVSFGAPQAARIGVLGYLPVFLAGEAISRKIIDKVDVQQSMGLSLKLQARAFALASRRLRAAFT